MANIDESMFKPSNIKNWSKIVLDTIDIVGSDDLAHENKIIIRGKEALFEYFDELIKLGISDIQNHDYILQIPTILYEYIDIIDRLSGSSYNELIYHIQLNIYHKYIKYFEDLIDSPPSSFIEIAKLIDVCIKFSRNNAIGLGPFLKLYDSFIEHECFGIVSSLKQAEGEYIYSEIDEYIYMLETLKNINNEINFIHIKARIMAVENKISRYNATHPNVNRRINDYEYILKQVYDFENNSYYTTLEIELVNGFDEISTHYGLNLPRCKTVDSDEDSDED